MKNADKLAILGEALFGEKWGRRSAALLGIDQTTMSRYQRKVYQPKDEHIIAMRRAVALKISDMEKALAETAGTI